MPLVIASQMEDGFNAQLRAHPLAPEVLAVPAERPWEVADQADVLLVRPAPAWTQARRTAAPQQWPGRVRWVYSASVGVDFYPRWLLQAPLVTCGRGIASDEIADYVIAALFLQSKDIEAVRARSPAQWQQAQLGRIAGTTLGILGLGAIGCAVASRALALGMNVQAVRRRAVPSPLPGVTVLNDLPALFATSDHVVLCLPATSATQAIIDAGLLAQAKPGLHLINVARGSIIDQAALVAALDSGRLGFATLDVTEPEPLPAGHPLWTHPKVRLTPHIASNYLLVRHRLFERIASNLARYARGETPTDVVDVTAGY